MPLPPSTSTDPENTYTYMDPGSPKPPKSGQFDSFLGSWGRGDQNNNTQTDEPNGENEPQTPEQDGSAMQSQDTGDGAPLSMKSSRRSKGLPPITNLPRMQTIRRQDSERRINLTPHGLKERGWRDEQRSRNRALSAAVKRVTSRIAESQRNLSFTNMRMLAQESPLAQAEVDDFRSDLENHMLSQRTFTGRTLIGDNETYEEPEKISFDDVEGDVALSEVQSDREDGLMNDPEFQRELAQRWILNISMQWRDKSSREKFFVTYNERPNKWRKVSISVDYRNAPSDSLEADLMTLGYQRDKCARIYEAIRDSLPEVQFYESVTNLKLETTSEDCRLHVHVTEDVNEIIDFPPISAVNHLEDCTAFPERDIDFHSHISGFVYKVVVKGQIYVKKEIPSPDTVDEFLYEINALHALRDTKSVIRFAGVVVDNDRERITGLLIDFASGGALLDILYDAGEDGDLIPWARREKWARQVVEGLADIHERGFVQGDFTLSNIVTDANDDAVIIDINRRGCPIGWEPPELIGLVKSDQKLAMYIGVKTDLYQLGMVLWALAKHEEEPDRHAPPYDFDERDVEIPEWYKEIVMTCLSEKPTGRKSAQALVAKWLAGTEQECSDNEPRRGRLHPEHDWRAIDERSWRSASPDAMEQARAAITAATAHVDMPNGEDRSRNLALPLHQDSGYAEMRNVPLPKKHAEPRDATPRLDSATDPSSPGVELAGIGSLVETTNRLSSLQVPSTDVSEDIDLCASQELDEA